MKVKMIPFKLYSLFSLMIIMLNLHRALLLGLVAAKSSVYIYTACQPSRSLSQLQCTSTWIRKCSGEYCLFTSSMYIHICFGVTVCKDLKSRWPLPWAGAMHEVQFGITCSMPSSQSMVLCWNPGLVLGIRKSLSWSSRPVQCALSTLVASSGYSFR